MFEEFVGMEVNVNVALSNFMSGAGSIPTMFFGTLLASDSEKIVIDTKEEVGFAGGLSPFKSSSKRQEKMIINNKYIISVSIADNN